jgi:hypothetical protein
MKARLRRRTIFSMTSISLSRDCPESERAIMRIPSEILSCKYSVELASVFAGNGSGPKSCNSEGRASYLEVDGDIDDDSIA